MDWFNSSCVYGELLWKAPVAKMERNNSIRAMTEYVVRLERFLSSSKSSEK